MNYRKLVVFSAWEFVGNDIIKILGRTPKDLCESSGVVAVMTVAICPKALAYSVNNESARELARAYSEFYAENPQLTAKLLRAVQKKWNDQSITARVQRHLLTQAYHQRPIWRGKRCVQEGIFHEEVTAKEIQAKFFPKQNFGAKEANAVLKARQRIQPAIWQARVTRELNAALYDLRSRGFDVGLGS